MPDDVQRDDISYKIGDDRPLAWELQEHDGDALAAGQFTARAQVRRAPGMPLLHEWSTANGRAVIVSQTDGEAVRWLVKLLVDDSRSWTWERGEYDLYLTDPTGHDQPIAEGSWINRPAITDTGGGTGGGGG